MCTRSYIAMIKRMYAIWRVIWNSLYVGKVILKMIIFFVVIRWCKALSSKETNLYFLFIFNKVILVVPLINLHTNLRTIRKKLFIAFINTTSSDSLDISVCPNWLSQSAIITHIGLTTSNSNNNNNWSGKDETRRSCMADNNALYSCSSVGCGCRRQSKSEWGKVAIVVVVVVTAACLVLCCGGCGFVTLQVPPAAPPFSFSFILIRICHRKFCLICIARRWKRPSGCRSVLSGTSSSSSSSSWPASVMGHLPSWPFVFVVLSPAWLISAFACECLTMRRSATYLATVGHSLSPSLALPASLSLLWLNCVHWTLPTQSAPQLTQLRLHSSLCLFLSLFLFSYLHFAFVLALDFVFVCLADAHNLLLSLSLSRTGKHVS